MTITYVIELNNNKFYVGKTINLRTRLNRHKGNKKTGNKWVRKYKFKRLLGVMDGDVERILTLGMMEYFGWRNVRGYAWSQFYRKNPPHSLKGWRNEVERSVT